jgi:hypothetical protein
MPSPTTLDEILDTLAREAASGRIGRPSTVRGALELSADHGRLAPLLARALAAASRWLADPPARLYAAGSIASGVLTALLEGEKGTTALLSAAVLRAGAPRADFLVLGSRGSLSFEGDANAAHLHLALEAEGALGAREGKEAAALERAFLTALELSLARRAPAAVPTGKGGDDGSASEAKR